MFLVMLTTISKTLWASNVEISPANSLFQGENILGKPQMQRLTSGDDSLNICTLPDGLLKAIMDFYFKNKIYVLSKQKSLDNYFETTPCANKTYLNRDDFLNIRSVCRLFNALSSDNPLQNVGVEINMRRIYEAYAVIPRMMKIKILHPFSPIKRLFFWCGPLKAVDDEHSIGDQVGDFLDHKSITKQNRIGPSIGEGVESLTLRFNNPDINLGEYPKILESLQRGLPNIKHLFLRMPYKEFEDEMPNYISALEGFISAFHKLEELEIFNPDEYLYFLQEDVQIPASIKKLKISEINPETNLRLLEPFFMQCPNLKKIQVTVEWRLLAFHFGIPVDRFKNIFRVKMFLERQDLRHLHIIAFLNDAQKNR